MLIGTCPRTKEGSDAEEVYRAAEPGRTGAVRASRGQAQGDQPEGPPGQHPAESGRGRPGVDGQPDRRGVSVPRSNGGEHTQKVCAGRVSGGAGTQEAVNAPRDSVGWRAAGQAHCHATRAASERLRELDAPAAGAAGGGVGERRDHQPRDRPADAEKNGMTKRKIEYWVIPPEADAEVVGKMENVLETYAPPAR